MRNYTPLVCQYLESISREALGRYQDIVREYTRERQGVYALYRRGKLYYVGLASDLRLRLTQHLKDHHQGSWDRFSVYLTVGNSHLRELESLLLRIVRPSGNKQIGKFSRRCQNLRQRFSHDIRAYQRLELDTLLGRIRGNAPKDSRHTQGRRPVLARYIKGPMALQASFKGRTIAPVSARTGASGLTGGSSPRPRWQGPPRAGAEPAMDGVSGRTSGLPGIG
jgi:hypothetical protein